MGIDPSAVASREARLDLPWGQVRGDRARLGIVVASLIACVGALIAQASFLRWNETRQGVTLADPVLAWFDPVDLSTFTFVLIYGALLVSLSVLLRRPLRLALALRIYALTIAARILLMWLVPLDPPPQIIPMADPLVEFAAGQPLVRDLFFSGHTATLCMLALALPHGRLRSLMWAGMVVVAACTVLQHSHYLVDVLVAPPVVFLCAWLVEPSRWRSNQGPA